MEVRRRVCFGAGAGRRHAVRDRPLAHQALHHTELLWQQVRLPAAVDEFTARLGSLATADELGAHGGTIEVSSEEAWARPFRVSVPASSGG